MARQASSKPVSGLSSLGLIRLVCITARLDYITCWLKLPDGTEKSIRNTCGKGASRGRLNLSLIRNVHVLLPRFAEQRRILAKVKHRMALLDALETPFAASRTTAANLLSAELTPMNP